MINTLKTSSHTESIFDQFNSITHITPNILARIAVSLSLKDPNPVSTEGKNNDGKYYNRSTLTGNYDYVYKALFAQHIGREISDEEFFPTLFNAHLERGLGILTSEYEYAGNYERLIINFLNLDFKEF